MKKIFLLLISFLLITGCSSKTFYDEISYDELNNMLDDKTKIVASARIKYPEVSFQELADIITSEYDYKIGKSGINHHFIKIKELVKRHKESRNKE